MKKIDFWFLSLIAFFAIAVAFGWNIWLKITVIANSILVLIQTTYQLYQRRKNLG